MRLRRLFALLACVSGIGAPQQTDRPDVQFEVASIKPSAPGAGGTTIYNSPERFRIDGATVKYLIGYAYDLRQFQIVDAPGWADAERYDVVAKAQGSMSDTRIRLMVENLLVERMSLAVHREKKEMSIFALIVAKGGLKLRASPQPAGPTARGPEGRLEGTNLTLEMLASLLADRVGRPVHDRTGITGQFDIQLQWAPDGSSDTGPSIFTALQGQLGLRLQTERAPTDVLVVEHVDRPAPN